MTATSGLSSTHLVDVYLYSLPDMAPPRAHHVRACVVIPPTGCRWMGPFISDVRKSFGFSPPWSALGRIKLRPLLYLVYGNPSSPLSANILCEWPLISLSSNALPLSLGALFASLSIGRLCLSSRVWSLSYPALVGPLILLESRTSLSAVQFIHLTATKTQ